jgi:hypothetical protein
VGGVKVLAILILPWIVLGLIGLAGYGLWRLFS